MPFKPELNFFYLYLKEHLEKKHSLNVERGDQNILTIALLDKIRSQVLSADVIICDISGKNPNVFYELGYAHAFKKPVILLTQDPPENAPVNTRQFEPIHYDLSDERNLLAKVDNAIHNIFKHEFSELYEDAFQLLSNFNIENGSHYEAASKEEFQARIMQTKVTAKLPEDKNSHEYSELLLPKILREATDIQLMRKVMDWIESSKPEEVS